jgi:hypothetical protein
MLTPLITMVSALSRRPGGLIPPTQRLRERRYTMGQTIRAALRLCMFEEAATERRRSSARRTRDGLSWRCQAMCRRADTPPLVSDA